MVEIHLLVTGWLNLQGGLTNASNITILQHGQSLSDNRVYMSIKVVYVPASNTWKFYDRIDFGAVSGGSFEDPQDETLGYSFAGMTTDDTHTRTSMNYFGFSHKYSALFHSIFGLIIFQ